VKFIQPVSGRVTSFFGHDVLQGKERQHWGIDWAQSGVINIKASADGTVSRSYLSTSYGECIFILHNIDGITYETVYAHMRSGSRKFHEGDHVTQGQVIGLMGSTGESTGQHLHFELHKGRWNIKKTNAVDPLNYVGVEDVKPVTVSATKQYINLHKHMTVWNHYGLTQSPVRSNASKTPLNPKKFGGLSYEIVGKGKEPDTYLIKTGQFGVRKIYAPKDNDSSISNHPIYK
jgi:murein DD-endopeptidase MepM/ murein hydrolase activator NlpD